MRYFFYGVIGVAIVLGLVSCEVHIWHECRTDHSVLYCLRVLGH